MSSDLHTAIAAQLEANNIGMVVEFVPYSKSRNKDTKRLDSKGKPTLQPEYTLNWKVTIYRDGRKIITTDYAQGSGHCPASKASVKELGNANSIMRDAAIRQECETGKRYRFSDYGIMGSKLPPPSIVDIFCALVTDAEVINYSNFEDWASSVGYREPENETFY